MGEDNFVQSIKQRIIKHKIFLSLPVLIISFIFLLPFSLSNVFFFFIFLGALFLLIPPVIIGFFVNKEESVKVGLGCGLASITYILLVWISLERTLIYWLLLLIPFAFSFGILTSWMGSSIGDIFRKNINKSIIRMSGRKVILLSYASPFLLLLCTALLLGLINSNDEPFDEEYWLSKEAMHDYGLSKPSPSEYSPNLRVSLGILEWEKGNIDEALIIFDGVIEDNEKYGERYSDYRPFNMKAWIYATEKDSTHYNPQKAIETALIAVEITDWENPTPIDTLATAYAASGDFEMAYVTQLKAVELEPDNQLYRENLAMYEELKNQSL